MTSMRHDRSTCNSFYRALPYYALPPPYLTSKETAPNPYDPHDPSLYTPQLPTFEYSVPRRYSSRLRRLLQQRSSSRGVYLTLHIPHTLNNCKLISIESASSTSSSSSSSSSASSTGSSDDGASISTADTDYDCGMNENLIHYHTTNLHHLNEKQPLLSPSSTTDLPFNEDLESGVLTLKPHRSSLKTSSSHLSKSLTKYKKSKRVKFKKDPKYRHRDRLAYGYIGDEEKETSWLTFFLLLLLAFTMVCAAGVFIAWALGFAGGKAVAGAAGGLHSGIIAAAAAGPGAAKVVPPVVAAPVGGHHVPSQGAPVVQEVNGVPVKGGVKRNVKEEKRSSRIWKREEMAQEKRDFRFLKDLAGKVVKVDDKKKRDVEKRSMAGSSGSEEYVQNADVVF
ncbi:hypothetical protein TWF281_010965 [Arthrobotrys megalospora]